MPCTNGKKNRFCSTDSEGGLYPRSPLDRLALSFPPGNGWKEMLMKSRLQLSALLCAIGLAALASWGCGASAPSVPAVNVSPAVVQLQAGVGKQQFTATVLNDSNTRVVWKVNGELGGNAQIGTIDANGMYVAPASVPATNPVTISAFSVADPRVSASASATITPPVGITITPANPTVKLRQTVQFTANVANASNTAVTWSVNGTVGGNTTVGTIDTNGLYTAPSSFPGVGQITIAATSVIDPQQTASTTILLQAGVQVTVSPAAISMDLGTSQTFSASVMGSTNNAVNWSVNGIPGGNATVGVIDANGKYTAPSSMPPKSTVTLTATSQADATSSGSAQVTLTVPPGSFSLSPNSTTVTLAKGTSTTQAYTITTSAGFSGSIVLAVSGLPMNVSGTFDHPALTGSGTSNLTLAVSSVSLAAQSAPITVTATSTDKANAHVVQTATILLTITGWSGHVHTVAGAPGGMGFEDGGGTDDELQANAITNDGNGNLYFTDGRGYALRNFNLSTANVTTLLGSPYTFDVPNGEGLAEDVRTQTFYVADASTHEILSFTTGDTKAKVLAGNGKAGYADGAGNAAQFNSPHGLALSPDRTTLYVADTGNDVIRNVNVATGQVTTLAGQAGIAQSVDGSGSGAAFCHPWGLDVDPGNAHLYIADNCSDKIRRLTLAGDTVATLAGTGSSGGNDGPAASAQFSYLKDLKMDPHNNGGSLLYVVDDNRIRVLTLGNNSVVYTLAGQGGIGQSDGSGSQASFYGPLGMTVIPDLLGNNTSSIFVADTENGLLRRIDFANPLTANSGATANSRVTTIAGQPPHRGGIDGAGTGSGFSNVSIARFDGPAGIATDGKVAYVADSNNQTVRMVDLKSTAVSTIAGTGHSGSGDGPAPQASFNFPKGVALVSSQGVLYIADTGNSLIRKLDLNAQVMSTIAGGASTGDVDGPLAAARFNHPYGVAASDDGNKLYIADTGNNAIRLVDLQAGTVSTIAGGGGAGSADGSGKAASFNMPVGVALSHDQTILYVSDYGNHTIRRMDLGSGQVTTIAGQVNRCGHTDGFGTSATLCSPAQLATDGDSLFWSDSTTGLVRVLTLSTGQVSTMAGTPAVLHMADGDYTEIPGALGGPVRYNTTFGIAVAPDASFLLFSDDTANVIRIVQ